MSNETGNEGIIMSSGSIDAVVIAVGQNAQVSGTVIKTIGQLQDSENPESPKLADLLKQLQAVIEADPDLSQEDKAEALEQVKVLAEAGQNPQEGGKQKAAKKAMRMIKGIITELPTAAKLVEECGKLLPTIAQIFAL